MQTAVVLPGSSRNIGTNIVHFNHVNRVPVIPIPQKLGIPMPTIIASNPNSVMSNPNIVISNPNIVMSKSNIICPTPNNNNNNFGSNIVVPTVPKFIMNNHQNIVIPKSPTKFTDTINKKSTLKIIDNMGVYNEFTKIEELILRSWQVDWANKAYNILAKNHGYIDTSKMGSGKTYVTLWIAKQYGFSIFVICPVGMKQIWKETAQKYGVNIVAIIGYRSVGTSKGHQPKHGYLYRHDNVTEGGIHQVNFSPTSQYLDLINKGILLVCDEIQNIKNNTSQYKACNSLIKPIISGGGRSRFALLSGTPFDKEEHAVNLLKLIGYIKSPRLYTYDKSTRKLILEGIQDLINICRYFNVNLTNQILDEIPPTKSKMHNLCYILYVKVIKPQILGAMSIPQNITAKFDVKNGFYNISQDKIDDLRYAIDQLALAVRYNEGAGTAELNAQNIGTVGYLLRKIENAKVGDFARIAHSDLIQDPTCKIIISVNYTVGTIKELSDLLAFYRPLILNGEVAPEKRPAIIKLFNENFEYRVLIMNTSIASGFGLHDIIGNAPRKMIISPTYKMLETAQAAFRIYRDNTKSDAQVRIFYGKGAGLQETGILSAMIRKTEITKGAVDDVIANTLLLPGDYTDYIEPNVNRN